MKMFTRLTGLMVMLLLISAISVGQGAAKLSPDTPKAYQMQSNLMGEPGDSFNPDFNPYTSQAEQKEIGGTDDVKIWVLPTNGATSGNSRAPSNSWNYQRTEYLILGSEIAASGFPNGATVNSISFYIYTAGVGTLTGDLKIYLMNTSDVTYNLGTNWTTAGFTMVHSDPAFVVPISPTSGVYNITFAGGSPFTYTGAGVYVAWEFSAVGTVGTTAVVHNCNTTLTNGLYGNRSTTSMPATLAASNWRPATRFGTTSFDDVLQITNVYTLGKLPVPYGLPTTVGVRVENVTASSATFNVTLEVRDVATNTLKYTATQSGVTLTGGAAATYSFPGWTPATLEDVKVIGIASAAPGETWTTNNTLFELAQVNNNLFSHFYPYVPGSGYGYTTPGEGIFATKYFMTGTGSVNGVNIFIYNFAANTGATIFACILNSAGTIVAQSPNYVIAPGDLGLNKNFGFAPVVFTNEEFYVGIGQTYLSGTTQYYPLGIIAENPLRSGAFYNFAITGGTPTASTATWKYMIEAVIGAVAPCDPPTNPNAANITSTTTDLIWTSVSGLSDVEFGPTGFTPTGTPNYPGVTSPITVPTALASGYDFYVRDVCAGPLYSQWVLKTFWTFCEPCPGGAINEGEPQLPDGSTLAGINGGCAFGDPLLTSPIALGQTYCGQSNSYINDVAAPARDNDYYYLNLTSPANIYWNLNVTLKGNGLYNLIVFDAGDMTCAIGAIAQFTTTTGCETATINVDVPSGNYYIVARVATAAGNLWPYGSGPWTYVLSVTGTQLGAPVLSPAPVAIEKLVAPGTIGNENLVIGNSGTYKLDYAASTSGTFAPTFGDNFDTYVAGVQLASQNPTDWTTWSIAPGSTEDPVVSSDVAYSAANSVLITGVNDCVHTFPNYTSGSHKISFRMLVPAGFDGYFNVLQLFAGASSEWGTQAYFDAGGVASIDAGAAAAATWSFNYDTWFYNELYIDLDGDYAEYYFDGNFIVGWQWSKGTFGSGTLKQLGGVNFYAYAGTQTPKFYFDNFLFETAGNDWLTLNGGLGASGTVNAGSPAVNIVLGFDATGKPVGEYTKTINLTTNELGAKASYSIPVTMRVGYEVAGILYYGLTNTKALWTNISVTLTPTVPPGAPITVTPSVGGGFNIRPLGNGAYALTGATTKPWGGLTTFDATLILRYAAGVPGFGMTDLQKRAADVNMTNTAGGVTTFDATLILRRAAGITPLPQWTAPNFVFDGPYPSTPALIGLPVTVAGANVTQNLRTLCSGDVNGSYAATIPSE